MSESAVLPQGLLASFGVQPPAEQYWSIGKWILDALTPAYLKQPGPADVPPGAVGKVPSAQHDWPSAAVLGGLDLATSLTPAGAAKAAALPALGLAARQAAPIRAWHASPHNFDRFSVGHIGRGEGAASYGDGLYFAENPALSGPLGFYDRQFTRQNMEGSPYQRHSQPILEGLRSGKTDDEIYADLAISGRLYGPDQKKALDEVKAKRARVYEVEINADQSKMIDWDAPLSEQPDSVGKVIRDLGVIPRLDSSMVGADAYRAISNELMGRWFGRNAPPVGLSGYDALTPLLPQARQGVMREMADRGVPGVRYWDEGSRNAGVGTRNYVVFDDGLIDIIRKYGLAAGVIPAGAAAKGFAQDPGGM